MSSVTNETPYKQGPRSMGGGGGGGGGGHVPSNIFRIIES